MIDQTAEELVTELTMQVQATPRKAIIIVEGETDSRLLSRLLNAYEQILLFPAGNSDLAIEAANVIHRDPSLPTQLPAFRVVIDRDYRIPLNTLPNCPEIIITDERDIEAMMIASAAFDSVLSEVASTKKITSKFGGIQKLRDRIASIAEIVGSIRYYSQKENIHYSFKHLSYEKFVDASTCLLDESRFIRHLAGSQFDKPQLSNASISAARRDTASNPYFTRSLLITSGHDLMDLLSVIIRKSIGGPNAANVKDSQSLESLFRLAFPAYWGGTAMIASLRTWLIGLGLATDLVDAR